MASIRLEVQQVRQNGQTIYQFALTPKLLKSLRAIIGNIYYDPRTMQGTQRKCSQERRDDLGRFILNAQNILPTTLLFNARKAVDGRPTDEPHALRFRPSEAGSRFGTVTIDPKDVFLSITDGSGRYHGYCDVMEDLKECFELSCVLMATDASNENFHFLVINDTQVRIPKEITFDAMARLDGDMPVERIESLPARQRRIAGRAGRARPIFQMLFERNDGPFADNVLFENMTLANDEANGDYKLHRLGEVFSKAPASIAQNKARLFPHSDDVDEDTEMKALLVCNFFRAIEMKIKGSFRSNGTRYSVTDSNSLYILESFLRELFELDSNLRGTVPPAAKFLQYLQGSSHMQPKFWEKMSLPDVKKQKDHVSRHHGISNLQNLGKDIANEAFKKCQRMRASA